MSRNLISLGFLAQAFALLAGAMNCGPAIKLAQGLHPDEQSRRLTSAKEAREIIAGLDAAIARRDVVESPATQSLRASLQPTVETGYPPISPDEQLRLFAIPGLWGPRFPIKRPNQTLLVRDGLARRKFNTGDLVYTDRSTAGPTAIVTGIRVVGKKQETIWLREYDAATGTVRERTYFPSCDCFYDGRADSPNAPAVVAALVTAGRPKLIEPGTARPPAVAPPAVLAAPKPAAAAVATKPASPPVNLGAGQPFRFRRAPGGHEYTGVILGKLDGQYTVRMIETNGAVSEVRIPESMVADAVAAKRDPPRIEQLIEAAKLRTTQLPGNYNLAAVARAKLAAAPQVSPGLGRRFEAHDISGGSITDQTRRLANFLGNPALEPVGTRNFSDSDKSPAAKEGLFTLVGGYDQYLNKGAAIVFVHDDFANVLIPLLQQRYPNVRFAPLSQNARVLSEAAPAKK